MSAQGMSAYRPENEEAEPPSLPAKKSNIPKVMGILHLLIGGVTLLSGLFAIIQNVPVAESFGEKFVGLEEAGVFVSEETLEKLAALNSPCRWLGYLDVVTSLLLIGAGIGLLKYVQWGRSLSNLYVALSLLGKCYYAYLMLVVAKPFFEAFVRENNDLAIVGAGGMQVIVVSSIVVSSCYAVGTAIVVNVKGCRKSLGGISGSK